MRRTSKATKRKRLKPPHVKPLRSTLDVPVPQDLLDPLLRRRPEPAANSVGRSRMIKTRWM